MTSDHIKVHMVRLSASGCNQKVSLNFRKPKGLTSVKIIRTHQLSAKALTTVGAS